MSSDGSTVLFGAHPSQYKLNAAAKRQLQRFARTLAQRIANGRSFECLIANDQELQRLNLNFLGQDYPTDVLSFPNAEPDAELGQIAISIERAAEQAAQFGHSLVEELQILMLHGVLHLAGFDHETDSGEMAAAEQHWRAEFQLPHALIGRAQFLEASL
jgi:probable rRNA maturation factor